MEIITGNRQIKLDALEVLALEERTALDLTEEPRVKESLRQIFQERREAMSQPQKFEFTVAPMDLASQYQAMMFARKMGVWDGETQDLPPQIISLAIFLMQIQAWKGFEGGGQPLPCTHENKVLVFGQAPMVIRAALEKLSHQEEAERKNFETSPVG